MMISEQEFMDPIIQALEIAIDEADGWCYEARGLMVNNPEMNFARGILENLKATSGSTGKQ